MELDVPSVESDASLSKTDTASDTEDITQPGMYFQGWLKLLLQLLYHCTLGSNYRIIQGHFLRS